VRALRRPRAVRRRELQRLDGLHPAPRFLGPLGEEVMALVWKPPFTEVVALRLEAVRAA
jgi:hypothetical protein